MNRVAEQWVDVVYIQDWESEDYAGGPEWGDRDAMAQWMAEWDYGDDTDAYRTLPKGEGPYRLPTYTATEHVIRGLTYVLETSRLGDAALYRRALNSGRGGVA